MGFCWVRAWVLVHYSARTGACLEGEGGCCVDKPFHPGKKKREEGEQSRAGLSGLSGLSGKGFAVGI